MKTLHPVIPIRADMFWFLHRLVRFVGWVFLAGVAFYLYQQRAALEPVWDYAELWWNRPSRLPGSLPQIAGEVTQVYSGDGLQIRDDQGTRFNYGLAGVVAPKPAPDASEVQRQLARTSLTNLAVLALGQKVTIDVTLENPASRTGLGLVRLGPTNLNERVLAEGWGRLKREQIRTLSLMEQFELVSAERAARKRGKGLWSAEP